MKNYFTRLLLVSVVLMTSYLSKAQVTEEWVQRFNGPSYMPDQANAMVVDDSGNVFVTGVSFSTNAGQKEDYVTIKYDSAGTVVWQRRFDGPGAGTDRPRDIAIDPWGNIIVTGTTPDSIGYNGMGTVKYDPAGNLIWFRHFSVAGPIGVHGEYMVLDSLGNIYITGNGGYDSTDTDFITIKYDSAGTHQWTAVYNGPSTQHDRPMGIRVDKAGNVFVAGGSSYDTTWSYSFGASAFTTIKYDNTGNELWVKKFSPTGMAGTRAMDMDDSGNVYVTGTLQYYEPVTYTHMLTVKYNTDGDMLWNSAYVGPLGRNEAKFVKVDRVGNVYVFGAGYTDSISSYANRDYMLLKYDANGIQQWAQIYMPVPGCAKCSDVATGLALDTAGNIYITGLSQNDSPTHIFYDYMTARYSPTGAQQWMQFYNGTGNRNDEPSAIAVDKRGDVYVTGKSEGLLSFVDDDFATIKYSQQIMPTAIKASAQDDLSFTSHPNPFARLTTISYAISRQSHVKLEIFDMMGRRVSTLVNQQQGAGSHRLAFNRENLAEGTYLCALTVDGQTVTRKLAVVD